MTIIFRLKIKTSTTPANKYGNLRKGRCRILPKIKRVILTLVLTVFITPLLIGGVAQADVYNSYKHLAANQKKGQDYHITSKDVGSKTAVIAIHGGKIEVGTCKIAKSVAKETNSNLYTFEGIKEGNNNSLHITSAKFSEPIAIEIVGKSSQTLSIHGCRGTNKVTYIGGLDKKLGAKIKNELKKAGFRVANPPNNLAGTNPNNICNQNKIKKGVQLELTYEMRQVLLKNKNQYNTYVNALNKAIK